MITVRPAQALDRPEVLTLFEEGQKLQEGAALIYQQMGAREEFLGHLEEGNVFVATTDEPVGIVGMSCVSGANGLQIIGNIIVRPDFRGAGVGAALVQSARITAEARAAKALMVIDRTDRRDSRLYREAGFRPVGELMELPL